MNVIDIILASYNGENFIEQQLLSLLGQSFKDWNCIIHDDGSTDGTIAIIKKYTAIDSRFIFIEDNIQLKNPGENFIHTLKYSNSDFICFCDQDDIWLESKLKKLYSTINHKNNDIPQVVFSNAYCWDSKKNRIEGNATLAFPTDIESLLFLNCGIQGASAIFNRKMKDILLVPIKNLVMHDWYLTIAGCSLGNIDYIHENLMLYRQHECNVTGHADKFMYKKIFCLFKRKNCLIDLKHLDSVKTFAFVWKEKLSKNDYLSIQDFIKSCDENFIFRLKFILKGKWRIYNSRLKLIAKFLIRPYLGVIK